MSLSRFAAPVGVHGVLSVLADTAETQQGHTVPKRRPNHFTWMNVAHADRLADWGQQGVSAADDNIDFARLGAIDAIRPGEDVLRVGWLWVVGRTDPENSKSGVVAPLILTKVRVQGNTLISDGELILSPLIEDRSDRLELETGLRSGGAAFGDGHLRSQTTPFLSPAALQSASRLRAFSQRLAQAAGFDPLPVEPAAQRHLLGQKKALRVVAGLAVYAEQVGLDFSATGSLRQWHEKILTAQTSLHSLYLERQNAAPEPGPDLPSAFPLTQSQHACVVQARRAPLTVISGAPGTGKTHTIAAIVGDHVARDASVLVAAKSEATVDAIVEMLTTRPGPDPVVFGSSTAKRTALTKLLTADRVQVTGRDEVDRHRADLTAKVSRRDELWQGAVRTLGGLALLDGQHADRTGAQDLYRRLPGLARADTDAFEVSRLIAIAGSNRPAWWQMRRRRAWAALCELLGTDHPEPGDLDSAVSLAAALRDLHDTDDLLHLGPDWAQLLAAQQAVEDATGRWMDARATDERRLTPAIRGVRGALATALRSYRGIRRARLAELGRGITQALPVWVGTLGDIDDLLPMLPSLFDLVILDEASSIDQPRAATALLRGDRAVIVGDPNQLRHVSFVSDDATEQAMARHAPGASPGLSGKLDIRRNSIFDVAAATTSITHLDEHFRSAAHLFSFVGRRLYDDRVQVATLTPANDHVDLITVHHQDAVRNKRKVVAAEVTRVLDRIAELREAGAGSVGIVSPFRAQADAIEEQALERFSRADIEALGLRVGTVHAFQGMERQIMLISLGIGTTDGANTWRFADDRHLLAVMATRARERVEWFVSADPPPGSLIGEYLAEQDEPPAPERLVLTTAGWTTDVAAHVMGASSGAVDGTSVDRLAVTAPYEVGRHVVDLCIIDRDAPVRFLGVITELHPDGPQAHIQRHVDLLRSGWPLVTALAAAWREKPGELGVHLRGAAASR